MIYFLLRIGRWKIENCHVYILKRTQAVKSFSTAWEQWKKVL